MKKFNLISLSILLSAILVGCGGGSGTTSVVPEEEETLNISSSTTTANGYYVDSAISGVSYLCGNQSGVTENNGKFIFEVGKSCTFTINSMELRTVEATKLFNNVEIIEDNILIAQFLQSLDNDADSSNGLIITQETKDTLLEKDILTLPTNELEIENIITELKNSNINFGGKFVSQNKAEEHLADIKIEEVKVESEVKSDELTAQEVQQEAESEAQTDKLEAQQAQKDAEAKAEVDRLAAEQAQKEAEEKAEADRVAAEKEASDKAKLEQETQKETYQVPVISDLDKERFLEEINSARATARSCGTEGDFPATSPLTWNTKLYEAAYEHNYDMKNSNIFSHYGSGTQYDITGVSIGKESSPYDRIVHSGYLEGSQNYSVGENIAQGQQDIQEAMKDWLNSDGHCASIMQSNFTEMGISKVPAEYGYYWTNKFGYR